MIYIADYRNFNNQGYHDPEWTVQISGVGVFENTLFGAIGPERLSHAS
jgi:hypothetical protein